MMQRVTRIGVRAPLLLCLLLAACDALSSAEDRLARGRAALDAGRLEAAVADARAVVEKDAANPDGWLLLARISLKYGDGESALKDIERARGAGATEDQWLALRDEALLLAGKFDELLQAGNASSASAGPDHQIAVATAAAAKGRTDEAVSAVAAVLASDPHHPRARLLDVRLSQLAGAGIAARQKLEALLADQPDFAQALVLQGQLALVDGDRAAALQNFGRAEAVSAAQLNVPEQLNLLAALVETQLVAGDPAAAAVAVGKLKMRAPQSPVTEYLSARVSLAQGDAGTAVATLQRSLARTPGSEPARLLLGAALMEQGSVEQARNHLTNLIAERPENIEARKLLARLYLSQGDNREAERVLTELPAGAAGDPTADWMRSAILSTSGQPAQALVLLEQAAKADPANIPLQLDLVRAYLVAGRNDEARARLQTIPPRQSDWTGKQLQVLTRVAGQSADEVRRSLLALATENPRDAELRTVIGQAWVQIDDLAAATEQFRGALSLNGKLAEARLGLAGVAMRQGNLELARSELENVIATDARNERAYLALAAIAARQGNAGNARQWLERAISAEPAAVESRLALAELSLREKNTAQAESLLSQAIEVSRNKPATLLRAGDIELRAGRPEKAIAAYEKLEQQRPSGVVAVRLYLARRSARQPAPEAVLKQWLRREPGDPQVRAALGEHLLQTGDYRAAIAEYEKLVQTTPAPVLLNNLAWAYQQAGDARAEATARRALEGAPANPAIADTLGWILLEKGRAAEALPLLQKAAEALPGDAEVQGHYQRAREQTENRG